jgi:hypothetical protein
MSTVGREHEPAEVLVGRWRTQGWTRESGTVPPPGSRRRTSASGWPAGTPSCIPWTPGFADTVQGAEIIGDDPARSSYVAQYFGSDGPAAYEASLAGEGEDLVWAMADDSTRFAGRFSADAAPLAGPLWDGKRLGRSSRPAVGRSVRAHNVRHVAGHRERSS